jgi:hypothetical protein
VNESISRKSELHGLSILTRPHHRVLICPATLDNRRHPRHDGLVLRLVVSPRCEERLLAAETFLCAVPADAEVLLVGPSRGAALDLAARIGAKRGITFGIHRLTLGRLAARLAATNLAKRGLTPASPRMLSLMDNSNTSRP